MPSKIKVKKSGGALESDSPENNDSLSPFVDSGDSDAALMFSPTSNSGITTPTSLSSSSSSPPSTPPPSTPPPLATPQIPPPVGLPVHVTSTPNQAIRSRDSPPPAPRKKFKKRRNPGTGGYRLRKTKKRKSKTKGKSRKSKN